MSTRHRQYADAEAAAQSALGAIRDAREEHVHGVGGDASEQAQRTAWRLPIDWIDAACSTTSIGLQSVEEVFMAHIVVRDHNDRPLRLIEAFHQMQTNGSLPLALPAGGSTRA